MADSSPSRPVASVRNRRWTLSTQWLEFVGPALVLPLFLSLAFLYFHEAWTSSTAWVGGCCDPEQIMWFLRWSSYAAGHWSDPFFTQHLDFPQGVNLMWNAAMPLAGIFLWPITAIRGPIVAYNLLVTLGVALSASCAYFALRRYCRGPIPALVGAGLYGFSPYVMSQAMQHANLAFVPIPPLLLLVLDELTSWRLSPRRLGLVVGVLTAIQLLLSEELLASEAVVVAITLTVLAILYPSYILPGVRYLGEVLLTAIVTFAVLGAWPLAVQFFGPQRIRGVPWGSSTYATDLLNFIVPTEAQAFAPPQALLLASHFSGLEHEANAYLGMPLLLLLGFIAGRSWTRTVVRVAAIVGVVVAILSLGSRLTFAGQSTDVPLPWALPARLPLVENILPNRLTVYMYLCAAILVVVFVDELIGSWTWKAGIPGLLVLAFALLPVLPREPYPAWSSTIPPFFTDWNQSGLRQGAVVLVAPRAEDGAGADQMLWQTVAGDAFRMPDGYAFIPGPHGSAYLNAAPTALFTSMDSIQLRAQMPTLDSRLRRAVERDIRRLAIDAVVVGPMDHRDLMLQFFTNLLGHRPEERGGVALWRDVRSPGAQPIR